MVLEVRRGGGVKFSSLTYTMKPIHVCVAVDVLDELGTAQSCTLIRWTAWIIMELSVCNPASKSLSSPRLQVSDSRQSLLSIISNQSIIRTSSHFRTSDPIPPLLGTFLLLPQHNHVLNSIPFAIFPFSRLRSQRQACILIEVRSRLRLTLQIEIEIEDSRRTVSGVDPCVVSIPMSRSNSM